MALTSIDTPVRNDNPVYQQWAAAVLGSSATLTGDPISVEGFDTAFVMMVSNHTWTGAVYGSVDGTNYGLLTAGGLQASSMSFTGGVAATGQAKLTKISGMRWLRIDITDTSASTSAATGFVALKV